MSQRKTLTMNPETLASRLEAAAIHYQTRAKLAQEEPRSAVVDALARQLEAQAQECCDWAELLRGELLSVGFDGDDLGLDVWTDDAPERIQAAEASRGA